MSVAPGTRLGPYEILAPIGAGGMGEVFRARDTRLERSVAIKILPAAFSADAQFRSRFEREAKTISQLNHPHICALYDIGRDKETDYLVMELIDGQTLAERLSRGPLPLPDVLRYGAQIADALDKAHRSGVVHRDLKPQNIMITRSGAKLLDFGLAKGAAVSAGDGTEVKPLTAEGTIVGTFFYMSPEQLEGANVDPRSDLFSFGAVLYEMATGRRAFDGKTKTSVIAAIVSSEPTPVSRIQPLTPPALDQLIRGCLAKDPDARIQSAHDVALQLRWIGESPEAMIRKPQRAWLPWIIAAVLALAIIGGAVYHFRAVEVAHPLRFTIPAPPGTSIDGVPAVSPEGRRIVFRALLPDGTVSLWLRSLDALDAKPLKGTDDASFAFWSPDGQKIGFMAHNKLSRLDLADGSIRTISDFVEDPPGGATWNSHDVILFVPRLEGTVYRVSANGGPIVPVVKTGRDIAYWPWFLPDGDHFLYVRENAGKPSNGLYVGSLSSGKTKPVVTGISGFAMSRTAYAAGHLYYAQGNIAGSLLAVSLYAQPFDLRKLEVTGEPEKIDDGVEFYSPGRAAFSVSNDGMLVYRKSGPPIVAQLAYVDRGGRKLASVGDLAPYGKFRLSPDERQIVFTRNEDNPSIWVLDTTRGSSMRAVLEEWAIWPVWMPDSRSLVYAAAIDGPPNIFLRRPNSPSERLTKTDQQDYPSSVTPDGRYAIYESVSTQTQTDIYAVPIAAPHKPFPILNSAAREEEGAVSPDGKWIAYTSDESRAKQIYVMAFPGGGGRVQISNSGGVAAHWSRDGRQLFYFEPGSRRVIAVKLDAGGGELRPSVPEPLFVLQSGLFDVTRDGRFIVSEDRLNPDAPGLTVLMNR